MWIGLAGKRLDPVGFLFSPRQDTLSSRFGLINLTNDVIWLPAFILFALEHARHPFNGHVE